MPRHETAARRYAEAAFEVATRDKTVESWRRELDASAAIVGDERVAHLLGNPAIAEETRLDLAESTFGKVVSRPVLNLIGLMLRRGRTNVTWPSRVAP